MAEEPPTKRKCLGADCENDAGTLQCPTCLKLGTKDSFFCSQDCFKKNWVSLAGRRTMRPVPSHLISSSARKPRGR